MTQITWEKQADSVPALTSARTSQRIQFIIGGVLLVAAVALLILSGTLTGASYFLTIDEVVSGDYVGQTVRLSGAVDGDTIVYDGSNLILDFTIVNIPTETTDLALTLHHAVNDATATRLIVHMEGEVKPDLLQHEAQAIITGRLGADGIFQADELLLKCPSRYEESVPEQAG